MEKEFLLGDVVSLVNNIYEKDLEGMKPIKISEELMQAIRNNAYHSNKNFTELLKTFQNKEIYLKFENEMIRIFPTAHYTSGGILVDKTFNVTERIFANGEIIFDGNIGIGRMPGHPFASAIISARIIADKILKMKIEIVNEETEFEIEKKIKSYSQENYIEYENKLREISDKCSSLILSKNFSQEEMLKIIKDIENNIELIYNDIQSVEVLNIYYQMNLLHEIVKEKLMEVE